MKSVTAVSTVLCFCQQRSIGTNQQSNTGGHTNFTQSSSCSWMVGQLKNRTTLSEMPCQHPKECLNEEYFHCKLWPDFLDLEWHAALHLFHAQVMLSLLLSILQLHLQFLLLPRDRMVFRRVVGLLGWRHLQLRHVTPCDTRPFL